jgi:hypothetical protein
MGGWVGSRAVLDTVMKRKIPTGNIIEKVAHSFLLIVWVIALHSECPGFELNRRHQYKI